jgi:uracil-DNA glycosylase
MAIGWEASGFVCAPSRGQALGGNDEPRNRHAGEGRRPCGGRDGDRLCRIERLTVVAVLLREPRTMSIDTRRKKILGEMGVEVWQRRGVDESPEAPVDAIVPPPAAAAVRQGTGIEEQTNVARRAVHSNPDHACRVAAMDWGELQAIVKDCTRCGLAQTRTQTVFGIGNRKAEWLIVGEAPGADEDRQGEPFVGRAGLAREQVFICNILKCRPPGNRDPKPEEEQACRDYLERQIRLVKPKIILAVGRIAAQNLMRVDTPIGKMRGQKYTYQDTGIPVVITYHPAYLLRSPLEKRKAWGDLQYAKKVFAGQA